MGAAAVLVDADWARAQLDNPGVVLAAAGENDSKRTRRLVCSCRHDRDAHRHYRAGSDCALCECPRWSPWNPVPRLARRRAR
jgi:hypothetical protein